MSVFQVVLLAFFGAFAIAGVLIFAFAVGSTSNNTVGPVVIWGTLDQNAFAAVLRAASENDPRLSQVTYVQKQPEKYIDTITEALASGSGPDLIVLRQDNAVHEASRIRAIPEATISETAFKNLFADAALPFVADTGILALPFVVDPLVLYWNRDLMQTAGYAKQPVYWDELNPIAQKVTKRTDTGTLTKSAVAFGEYVNVNNAKDILSMLIMQAGGSITLRDTTGKLIPALAPRTGTAGQGTVNALRFYTGFADSSKEESYTWNRARPESRTAFAAGDLALYVGYASEQQLITRMNPNLSFAIAPVPQMRNSTRSSNFARVYGFATTRTSANPSGSITVAYLLAGTEISRALSQALGIPSARRDNLNAQATGYEDLFNKQAIIARTWLDPNPEETDKVFRAMIENTTSGTTLVTESVSRADQELAQILEI